MILSDSSMNFEYCAFKHYSVQKSNCRFLVYISHTCWRSIRLLRLLLQLFAFWHYSLLLSVASMFAYISSEELGAWLKSIFLFALRFLIEIIIFGFVA